jgi:transcription termination factor Rho
VVELTEGAGGYLRQAANNYLPLRDDAVVPALIARDYALRDGTEIEGLARDGGGGRRVVVEIQKASGLSPEEYRALPHFQDLVSINPKEPFELRPSRRRRACASSTSSPYRTRPARPHRLAAQGRQRRSRHLGQAISKHHPEVHLMLLLVDERPEEVTHFRRAVKAEVLASSSDSAADSHLKLARLAMERAKRFVEAESTW